MTFLIGQQTGDDMKECLCNFRDRNEEESERDWMKDGMCMHHWMQTDYYRMKIGLEKTILTGELLDLITLMPDSQTREIVDYIMSLRTLRLRNQNLSSVGGNMVGVVVRVMKDRKFGFIRGRDNINYFFHKEDFNGHFDDLAADVMMKQNIEVEFIITESKRGPRAGEVRRLDGGIGQL